MVSALSIKFGGDFGFVIEVSEEEIIENQAVDHAEIRHFIPYAMQAIRN